MNSHEALVLFSPCAHKGETRLAIDLFPAVPQSFGSAHSEMVRRFKMKPSADVPGLLTLRAQVTLKEFLGFFGEDWGKALERWPLLRDFYSDRANSGPDSYASLDAWQKFYELIELGHLPLSIEVSFKEHY